MSKNKILTIVVPTYNVEKYLDRCLLSLTYDTKVLDKIEIIIVNDGSKDNSLAIARQYESKYPQSIKVIDKENGGHGSTINAGLETAVGKYFRIIDSDDWVNIDDFGKYILELEKLNTDIVLTRYSREMVYNGTNVAVGYDNLEYDKVYDINKLDLSLLGDGYFSLATSSIKTDKLRESKLYLDENTFYVDMEYVVLPMTHLSTFIYLDRDIYRYWLGRPQQSMDTKNLFNNRSHHARVVKRLVEFYTTQDLSKNKNQYVGKIITLMLCTHYNIYCDGDERIPRDAAKEMVQFDKWLKKKNIKLYRAVIKKTPHIDYHRKTGFMFAFFFHKPFKKLTYKLANRRLAREDKELIL